MSPFSRQTLVLLKVAQADGTILIKSGNIKKPVTTYSKPKFIRTTFK